ncbi:MAG: glycosyltransferase family 39 protein [Acidobacteria bacterium]|nr:glycosyltransferase family 39 protein [Acidobacteriota bacterium]
MGRQTGAARRHHLEESEQGPSPARRGAASPRWIVPAALSGALLVSAFFSTSPIHDPADAGTILPAHLHFSTRYLLISPYCDVMDSVSLFSSPQHAALLLAALAVLILARVRAARKRPAFNVRHELRILLAFVLGGAAFYAALLVGPRPMASLEVEDPDLVKVDFHSHTSASWDARSGFLASNNRAWHQDAGFDVSYVTDHQSYVIDHQLDVSTPQESHAAEFGELSNPAHAGAGTLLLRGLELSLWRKAIVIPGSPSLLRRSELEERMRTTGVRPEDAFPGALFVLPMPTDLPSTMPLRGKSPPPFAAIEISDGAPNGLQQSGRDRAAILALADRGNLAVVAGTNNHGWGRTVCAWNLLRIPEWRAMSPEAMDAAIVSSVLTNRRHAVQVAERRRPERAETTASAFASIPRTAWNLLTDLSPLQRVSWLTWIWGGFVAIALARSMRARPTSAGAPGTSEADRAAQGGSRPAWPLALLVVAGSGLLRFFMAGIIPLVPDETYYWDWSRHLAAGYFDHPPGVAVLIKAGVALIGDSILGVRLFPILAGVAACGLVVWMARRLGGDGAALRAALVLACLPFAAAGLVVATPDAPLLAALAASLACVLRAVEQPPGSRRAAMWWMAAGALCGLALASKYTAVLMPAGLLVALLATPSLRRHLATLWPYASGIVALAVFTPVIGWNAANGWASFAFQLHHGLGGEGGSGLARELSLLAGQAALGSPVLLTMIFVATIVSLRSAPPAPHRLLAILTDTTAVFFAVSALRKPVAPNWTGPAYLTGVVLLAITPGGPAWRRWLRIGTVVGAIFVAVIYAHAIYPVVRFRGSSDPIGRAYGWDALAEGAAQARAALGTVGARTVHVAADNYEDASELAFNLPDRPTVFALNLSGRPNEYDFWPGFTESARSGDALVLVLRQHRATPRAIALLSPHFESVRAGETVDLGRGRDAGSRRRIWILEGWRGTWPPPRAS